MKCINNNTLDIMSYTIVNRKINLYITYRQYVLPRNSRFTNCSKKKKKCVISSILSYYIYEDLKLRYNYINNCIYTLLFVECLQT